MSAINRMTRDFRSLLIRRMFMLKIFISLRDGVGHGWPSAVQGTAQPPLSAIVIRALLADDALSMILYLIALLSG